VFFFQLHPYFLAYVEVYLRTISLCPGRFTPAEMALRTHRLGACLEVL